MKPDNAINSDSKKRSDESFFGTLKTEMVYFQKFQQLDEAVAYISDYIHFYNCERLHSSLGYRTPTEFEANAA